MTRLPTVMLTRALVPGTSMVLPVPGADAEVGEHLVVVFSEPGREPAIVGTQARVEARHESSLGTLVEVHGERLVILADHDGSTAAITAVETGDVPSDLVEQVQRDLRTYMAVRSEAGLGGDVHLSLSKQPETASHQVASLLHVSWPELQEVLEAGDAAARLARAAAVPRRETTLLRATIAVRG